MSASVKLPPFAPPDLGTLGPEALREMLAAGEVVEECVRVLRKVDLNIVGEVLAGQGTFYELDHYPEGDVFDRETSSQYYYHAHRGVPGEHGHFHTFVRAGGMPDGVQPQPNPGGTRWPSGEDALSHLVAISMDPYGSPLGMFAVNRWVTDETWYGADDVVQMLERFDIDHAFPSWPVNRWLGAMLRLFAPQARALIAHRDEVVAAWAEARPGSDVFEDRELEITGSVRISVREQMAFLRNALS